MNAVIAKSLLAGLRTSARRVLVANLLLASLSFTQTAVEINLERVPRGGLQPQAVVDATGTTHLVYFGGQAAKGDLFYVRRPAGKSNWTEPLRVNSQPGAAIAIGTIRGAQMALGRGNRVHVAWNGSGSAQTHEGAPMLYSRLNDAGTGFEPQRDLISKAAGLDGGGSIAADARGNVSVFWHARIPGAPEGEQNRAVFMARSTDDGFKFQPEVQISPEGSGACGCCGLKAHASADGTVFVLFRGASTLEQRDQLLLASKNGKNFETLLRHPWAVKTCPMSHAALAGNKDRQFAAWETKETVFVSTMPSSGLKPSEPVTPGDGAKQRHPSIAVRGDGRALLVWTEGTGWQKGGALAWQELDENGRPVGTPARTSGVPVWSFGAAVAQADGSFRIFY